MAYRSPPFLIHRGAQYQQSSGIGGIFRGLIKWLVPAIKIGSRAAGTLGKAAVKSPIVKELVKEAKKGVVDTGIGLASSAVAGDNVKQRFKQDIAQARKRLGEAIDVGHSKSKRAKAITYSKKPRKKRAKQKTVSLFDQD